MWRNASSAASIRRPNGGVLGFIQNCRNIFGAGSAIARPIPPKPTPSLPPPLEPLLHARAIRLNNREPRAIAKYMQTNLNLIRER